MNTPQGQPTFIDLFCGCGGFSLGMERAGFRCLAAIDFNPEAITVFRRNFPHVPQILEKDLTQFGSSQLAGLLAADAVDVIVGGPPCQGFSTVRQADGANHGIRLVDDERRHLYREFLRNVDFFKPKVFVMENVLGIRSASEGEYFVRVQKEARALGYRVHTQVEDCVDLGLPQKRRRQLFIGTRLDLPGYFRPILQPAPRARSASGLPHRQCSGKLEFCASDNPAARPTLWDAIGDLPILRAGGGDDERDYDFGRRVEHVEHQGDTALNYLCDVLEIDRAAKLTHHVARPHSDRDLRDFLLLKEGESSAAAMRRGVVFEYPYQKHHFKDRYTRQNRWGPCSTIVAHLSKDGLMFIHPTQNRSLTPREAARIQSFPDWFELLIPRTHQFRVIGNAVPPLVSEAIGIAVKSYIEHTMKRPKTTKSELAPLPADENEAVSWLIPVLDLNNRALRGLPPEDLKRAWYSIAFLYTGLHPDGALDNGRKIIKPLEMMSPEEFRKPKFVHKDIRPNPMERIQSMMNGMNSGWVHTDLDPRFRGAPAGGWAWAQTDVKPGDVFYVIDLRQLPKTGLKVIPGTKPEAFAIISRKGQSVHEALVLEAIKNRNPVSAVSVEAYSIAMPDGYTKRKDVFFCPIAHQNVKSIEARTITTYNRLLSQTEPRLLYPYYEQSGWPVVLAPVAKEAWRRYGEGHLKDEEFYCSEAQIAGMFAD